MAGALGRSLPSGVQAFRQGQQRAEADKALAGLNLPPEMAQVLRALDPQMRQQAMASIALSGPPPVDREIRDLADGTQGVFENGELVRQVGPRDVEAAGDVTFEDYMAMTPQERQEFDQFKAAGRGPVAVTNVNLPQDNALLGAIGQEKAEVLRGDDTALAAVDKVASIDRIIALTERPEFADVSGPIFGGSFGELRAQFADNPAAREVLAEFNALGGMMTMAQLEAFTGPKTDFEFKQAQRLALNDTSMTPEEIRAGLRVHKAVAEQQAVRWAKDMLQLRIPDEVDPADFARQMEAAQGIISRFDTSRSNDPRGIRQFLPR